MAMTVVTERRFYVYVLFRHDTGEPFYVGKGKGARWLVHGSLSRFDKNLHKQRIIRQAMDAGCDLPKVKVAQRLTEVEAFAVERAYILAIGRGANGPLVNMSDGGEGQSGYVHAPEAMAKAAATRKKNGPPVFTESHREVCRQNGLANRGRKMPPGFGDKISALNKGRRHTDEAKAKISAAHKGKAISEDTRQKLATAGRLRVVSDVTKARLSQSGKKKIWPDDYSDAFVISARSRECKPASAETKAKISAANKGRVRSVEERAIISENLRKRAPISDETREKLSAWQRGKQRSAEDRQKMKDGWARRKAALLATQQ